MNALRMSWTREDGRLVARWTDTQEHHKFEIVCMRARMALPSSHRIADLTEEASVAETIRGPVNTSERI
jgi:hypothetical protein